MDYYSRHTNADGSFANDRDKTAERMVAKELEQEWGVIFHPYSKFSAIDWWIEGNRGQVWGFAELKANKTPYLKYILLNMRKYLNLYTIWLSQSARTLFLVHFTDGRIGYIPIQRVNGAIIKGGCREIVKAYNDTEPTIALDISKFKFIDRRVTI